MVYRLGLLLVAILLAACAAPAPPESDTPDLSLPALRALAYQLPGTAAPAPSTDPAAAAPPAVTLLEDVVARGQLGGDAVEEAALLLDQWTGEADSRLHLAVVAWQGDRAVQAGSVPLGDRVQVRDLRIVDGLVEADLVTAGPEDPTCCPSQKMTQRWRWQDGQLQPVESTVEGGRLAAADIASHEWQLTYWQEGEPALAEPPITLTWRDGQLVGFAGCNRFFAAVLDGQLPGDLLVTQPGATRMACPEPAASTETRFLSLLGKVDRFSFSPRGLALKYHLDGDRIGVLFFQVAGDVPRAMPVPARPTVPADDKPADEPFQQQKTHGYDDIGF